MYKNAATPKDLDLYKRKIISFDDTLSYYPWFTVSLNLKNSDLTKYFGKSKTADADFNNIFDIKVTPPQNEQVTIKGFIGKNVSLIPNKKDKDYDLSFSVAEKNLSNDKCTFIFFV